jgi:hypothetical protein
MGFTAVLAAAVFTAVVSMPIAVVSATASSSAGVGIAGSCVAKAKMTRFDRVGWRLGSLGFRLSTATKTRHVLGVACTTRAVKVTRSPDEKTKKGIVKTHDR